MIERAVGGRGREEGREAVKERENACLSEELQSSVWLGPRMLASGRLPTEK